MISAKASGSGEYIGAGPFAAAAQSLWSTVPVPSLGIPQGSALVIDTRLALRLHVREGVHVVIGQESDDLVRNMATLLGEGRWAVTVEQPGAAALVHLEAAA